MKGSAFKKVILIFFVILLLAMGVYYFDSGNPFFASEIITIMPFLLVIGFCLFLIVEILFGK